MFTVSKQFRSSLDDVPLPTSILVEDKYLSNYETTVHDQHCGANWLKFAYSCIETTFDVVFVVFKADTGGKVGQINDAVHNTRKTSSSNNDKRTQQLQ